jgi:N-acetylglucosamine malate deacetylase 1
MPLTYIIWTQNLELKNNAFIYFLKCYRVTQSYWSCTRCFVIQISVKLCVRSVKKEFYTIINMKKILFIIAAGLLSALSFPQAPAVKDTMRNILIVTAHPDDWEDGMGGTALLLKDKYHIHVCIVTKGQRGLSKEPSEETVKIRAIEAANACKLVNAELHFLDKVDGDALADKTGIDQVVKLLNDLNPVMIFTLWGIEVPDHAAVSNMTRMALYQTGMIHDREVYFFEAGRGGQTNQFEPDLYVNITDVKEKKDDLIRCHVCQNKDDGMRKHHEEQARFHGWVARCDYAEPFKTYYPITNIRWDNKRPQYTLLNLETPELLKPYETNKDVLIISTHPDDWEISMGGTALLMKDKYNIHVLILTRGEGIKPNKPGVNPAEARSQQAAEGCKKINASLHIMNFPDGKLTDEKELVDSILYWVNKINPGMIFMHWQFDKPDHAAAAIASSKALSINGMIHDHEIYYFGGLPATLKHFDPEFYINISSVAGEKEKLVHLHEMPIHEDGSLAKSIMEANHFYGVINSCDYAEGFRTQYPLINHRWNKKTKFSLLKL